MKNKVIITLLSFFYITISLANDTITIHFLFDKYALADEGKMSINNALKSQKNNIQSIHIIGYTDQIGSIIYNNKLSLKRALTVQEYLLNEGIDASVITLVTGKGEDDLVTTSYLEKDRQLNRRVTIYIEYRKPEPIVQIEEKPTEKTTPKTEPTLTKKIKDSTLKKGDKLILKNINFIGGQHDFLVESYPALQELLEAMQNIPSLIIAIQGHICCSVNNQDGLDLATRTQDLSVRRAKAVYDFLVQNGIAKNRMSYEGMAHRYPITLERDEAERSINRRVEIIIIQK